MKKSKTSKSKFAAKRSKEQRYFSEDARKAIIAQIDDGLITLTEASRKYEVSTRSICDWRLKYSPTYEAPLRKVVEHQSDSVRNKQLQVELAEAYQLIGQMQAKTVLLEKIIELADQEWQTDLKKTFANRPSPTISSTHKKES